MANRFDSQALLARFYDLRRGPRVCLRLARRADRPGLSELLQRQGRRAEAFELARLVGADPRQMVAITATGLVDGHHQVLGFGAMAVAESAAEPELLVVDRQRTEGLDELLSDALRVRARALARRHAA